MPADLQLSSDPVTRAIGRLIIAKPFYGYLLSQFRRERAPDLPAPMAVGIDKRGDLVLYLNPERMVCPADGSRILDRSRPTRPWTDQEVTAVLEHECLHVVHDHISRREWRDAKLFNIATDIAINPMISGLPKTGIWPKDYGLEDGSSAEAYYEALKKDQSECPVCSKGGKKGQGDSCPSCGSGGIDDHSSWDKGDAIPKGMRREIVRQAVGKAYRRHKQSPGQGTMPEGLERLISEALKPPYDWKPLLRRFCHGAVKMGRRATRYRPHRRYGEFFPGKRPKRAGKVAVLIDTSGSIGAQDLAQFFAELKVIAESVQLVAVECDAAIQDVYEFKRNSKTPQFKGGGGTVFTQVFEAVAGRLRDRIHPKQGWLADCEALILLTDGAASVPATNLTGRPVLWALTPGGKKPAAYGEEIYIGEWKEIPQKAPA
jgi:predicted metal-dependent peptidase